MYLFGLACFYLRRARCFELGLHQVAPWVYQGLGRIKANAFLSGRWPTKREREGSLKCGNMNAPCDLNHYFCLDFLFLCRFLCSIRRTLLECETRLASAAPTSPSRSWRYTPSSLTRVPLGFYRHRKLSVLSRAKPERQQRLTKPGRRLAN